MRMRSLLPLAVLLLAGCGTGDSTSYMIDNNREHALILIRDKQWLWSDWEVSMIVARLPDCQRRHPLKNVSKDVVFKMELYESLEGGYILHQGKRWYVADTAKCDLQQFPEPPKEPGDLIGVFTDKEDGQLRFKADEEAAKAREAQQKASQAAAGAPVDGAAAQEQPATTNR
ncbi:MAG TPA: hypothetical protein VFW68_04150 [Rhodocyclaceae bacterium]|nr:hypothetical protein [Rhodocyclaceae bacterium]